MPERLRDAVFKILEALGESVWQRNLQTNEIVITVGLWRNLGFSEEVIPKSLEEALAYFAPEDAVRVIDELGKYLDGHSNVYDTRARLRSAAGEWRWLRFTGAVVERNVEGEPLIVGGLMSDVTAQVARETECQAAAERLAKLSTRERMIVQGIVAGKSSKEMALEQNLSPRTVEYYRARLMRKLGVPDILSLVQLAAAADWTSQS